MPTLNFTVDGKPAKAKRGRMLLPIILEMGRAGYEPSKIGKRLLDLDPDLMKRSYYPGYQLLDPKANLYAGVMRILRLYDVLDDAKVAANSLLTKQMSIARSHHVWLLRTEGETFKEIAARIGVSSSRAQQIFAKEVRRIKRAGC